MRALLGTHSFVWFIAGDVRLSAQARLFVEDPEHDLSLSIVSVWEIAIKHSLGKLSLTRPFEEVIPQ